MITGILLEDRSLCPCGQPATVEVWVRARNGAANPHRGSMQACVRCAPRLEGILERVARSARQRSGRWWQGTAPALLGDGEMPIFVPLPLEKMLPYRYAVESRRRHTRPRLP